eukprot:7378195-Prymnesium_polylepis.1
MDHVNPKSILGKDRNYAPVRLSEVYLPTCWLMGGADAKTVLTADSVFDAAAVDFVAISRERHHGNAPDMLRPHG